MFLFSVFPWARLYETPIIIYLMRPTSAAWSTHETHAIPGTSPASSPLLPKWYLFGGCTDARGDCRLIRAVIGS